MGEGVDKIQRVVWAGRSPDKLYDGALYGLLFDENIAPGAVSHGGIFTWWENEDDVNEKLCVPNFGRNADVFIGAYSLAPELHFSLAPSGSPSTTPTARPTAAPSASPSKSDAPTALPSGAPSQSPSSSPTTIPSTVPTENPTDTPTEDPSEDPSPPTFEGRAKARCDSGGMPPDPRTSSAGMPTSLTTDVDNDNTYDVDEEALSPNFGTIAEEDSEGRGSNIRRKKGSGLAGKIISSLMISANALASAAHQTWTQTVRYNRLDFAEVCCTADSQLSGEVLSCGGSAHRYSHWNGFDLTTRKGAEALRDGLDATRPRWVWFSPPCGPDSPMQNLNQRTEEQRHNLTWKKSRAHRIQRNILEIVIWLQRSEWCEEVVLEQSSSCRSLGVNGTFGELKCQFHGALVPGCQWGLKSQGFLSSKSWYLVTKTRITSDALGAKTCLKDHYHKPLERDEVTLSAGYTASFRRAVVSIILAPERKTYEDTLALLDVSSEKHAATCHLGSDGKTLPAEDVLVPPELIAPALVKRSHKKKVVRGLRVRQLPGFHAMVRPNKTQMVKRCRTKYRWPQQIPTFLW